MTRYSASRRKKDVAGMHDSGKSWATCGECGKRGFPSKTAVKNAQRSIRRDNAAAGVEPVTDGAVLRPYRCPSTKTWHLGHSTRVGRPNLNDRNLTFLPESGAA